MERKTEDDVKLANIISQLATVFSVDMTDEVVEAYYDALGDLDPSIVKLASRELLREAQFMPRPAELRRVAQKIAAEASGKLAEPEHWRKDRYDCVNCRDTGWIKIYHPVALKAAMNYVLGKISYEQFRRRQGYEAFVKCVCRIGQSRPGSASTYDAQQNDVRITAVAFDQRTENLLVWARNHKLPNHVDEFDLYNETVETF